MSKQEASQYTVLLPKNGIREKKFKQEFCQLEDEEIANVLAKIYQLQNYRPAADSDDTGKEYLNSRYETHAYDIPNSPKWLLFMIDMMDEEITVLKLCEGFLSDTDPALKNEIYTEAWDELNLEHPPTREPLR